ncbi:MAG: RIP metalloprotease RseP [Bacteroidales bacterium]
MEILIRILQLFLSLSILVIFHEFGHFAAAKIFKTRVEKFYLFFDPWFSIFKFKHKETEYGIGWLPLGGYVKISGMIDESMDKDQLAKEPQPWEFRSKPAWQRLIIMIGGVTVNVILAMAIYIMMLWTNGQTYLPTSEVNKNGIYPDSIAQVIGFKEGDKILKVGDKYVKDFQRIPLEIILNQPKFVEVERDNKIVEVPITGEDLALMVNAKSPYLLSPAIPFIVDSIQENSAAQKAMLKKGDQIIGVNGQSTPTYYQIREKILALKGKETKIEVLRNQDTLGINIKIPETGYIGTFVKNELAFFKYNTQEFTLLQAIPAGIAKGYTEIGNYLKQIKLIANPDAKAYEHVGGFITIGKIFPGTWNWIVFWRITALLSIMLAVVNILPIPALDGGHVLFLIYEVIARRKPSDKFMEVAQVAGMVILFALLIYANGNDIIKLFK